MQWRVRGASATTGIDATISVEATTVSEAHAIASKRGMLVESLDPVEIEARAPEMLMQLPDYESRRAAFMQSMEYSELRRESKWIALLGTILLVIGCLFMLVAVGIAAFALFDHLNHDPDPIPPSLVTTAVAACFINAFLFWTASAILRMLGYIGLAVRDIASSTRVKA